MSRPDVSRVEYDAALERVREASCCNVELLKECPRCERVTLAALGLDEPPTEKPKAWERGTTNYNLRVRLGAMAGTVEVYGAGVGGVSASNAALTADEARAMAAALIEHADHIKPPSEPPKACPTCGSGWTYHHACPDRGSGIDGGTA